MQKKAKRKNSVRNLAAVTTVTAIILIVSTYAWFIALDEVQVSEFNVSIAPTEGLEFSLNGTEWFGGADAVGGAAATNLTVNEGNYNTGAYTNNTNSWTGIKSDDGAGNVEHYGLIPMSSTGQIDTTASRLKLYDKASLSSTDLDAAGNLTTTEWGYRLMANQVPNDGASEHPGYIAFDLFIKNTTELQYYDEVDIQNEEAIYLTTDSVVTAGTANYGLENSVRVGFASIARVEIPESGDIDPTTAAGLNCASADAICRPAAIWEPNDAKHSANAVTFYEDNCTTRPYDAATPGTCGTLADTVASPTYAVTGNIASTDAVDVYDGAAFNGHTATSDESGSTLPKILNMQTTTLLDSYNEYVAGTANTAGIGYYFTDTMKNTGVTYEADGVTIDTADQDDRPPFMYLAPNSITKVRVYVWLEGQDIDNYDWASLGQSINVNFGFTKQQLSDEIGA